MTSTYITAHKLNIASYSTGFAKVGKGESQVKPREMLL
jgi:hypothetical protein